MADLKEGQPYVDSDEAATALHLYLANYPAPPPATAPPPPPPPPQEAQTKGGMHCALERWGQGGDSVW
jgi:hypothetical protein